MVDVFTEITIAAPRERVSRYVTDPSNGPAWFKHVKAIESLTRTPVQAGTRFTWVAGPPGVGIRLTYDVIEVVPGERLVMRTTQGPFPMETTYTWSDHAGGTIMGLRNRGEPRGPIRLVAPVMVAGMRRANRADMSRLKSILEAG
jgi:uncharacterized protein YndB with AHSA1/START domain